jgi:hypothetical protein
MNETASRADAWIGQRTQSKLTWKSSPKTEFDQLENHHRNCFPSWHFVSSEHTVLVDLVIVTENRVAHDSEIINETAYIVEA